MEILTSIFSALGVGGILLFFVKRYFAKRDRQEQARAGTSVRTASPAN